MKEKCTITDSCSLLQNFVAERRTGATKPKKRKKRTTTKKMEKNVWESMTGKVRTQKRRSKQWKRTKRTFEEVKNIKAITRNTQENKTR